MAEPPDPIEPEVHLPLLDRPEMETLEYVEDELEAWPQAEQAALDMEKRAWEAMTVGERRSALREVVDGIRHPMPEGLVCLCCQAHAAGDRTMLSLAFEALAKRATPLLIAQAWGVPKDEKLDQAQEVLLKIFAAIRDGKAGFAAARFAAYTWRRARDLYRARKSTWEGANQRDEPSEMIDPLDDVPCRASGPEFRALISIALARLPRQRAEAFIQYHHYGLTQVEIAEHHGVTVRTVHAWLKNTAHALGLLGDDYEL